MSYEELFKELQEVADAVKKAVVTIQDAAEDGRIQLREAVAIAKAAAAVIKELSDVFELLNPVIYVETEALSQQVEAQAQQPDA